MVVFSQNPAQSELPLAVTVEGVVKIHGGGSWRGMAPCRMSATVGGKISEAGMQKVARVRRAPSRGQC